jgi:lipopolysaccharide transport system ATP-binding protein
VSVPDGRTAVFAHELTKHYRLYSGPGARLAEWLTRRPRHLVHRALDGIEFRQLRGEGIAVVGENGAGKSTLLKLVAGVSRPTSGQLEVDGRVAAILELGSGFHPAFTGRQNIRLNAALLGLSEAEIRVREPEIVAWSELGDFIDRPVREYSSGMVVRLGFSIATQVDPEILIVDEALSVGDGYFQKKSMDRMVAFVESGGTLLFCSHALYLISAFCEKALWLRQGKVAAFGATPDVVREYEEYLLTRQREAAAPGRARSAVRSAADDDAQGPVRLLSMRALDRPGDRPTWRPGESVRFEVIFESDDPARPIHVGALLESEEGLVVSSFGSNLPGLPPFSGRQRHEVVLEIPSLPLVKGSYNLTFLLLDDRGLHVYDRRYLRHALSVESAHFDSGFVHVPYRWTGS